MVCHKTNLRIENHRVSCYGDAIKSKGADAAMNYKKPTTIHIAAMVDDLDDAGTRAVYMVVKQIYELQKILRKE